VTRWRTAVAYLERPAAEPASDDPAGAEALFALLYEELHRLARRQRARGARDLTLGTTTLLHEAYLDMARRNSVFEDRARFMGYASRVMRSLIINHVRHRKAQKRGGLFELTAQEEEVADAGAGAGAAELVRIGRAVDELAEVEPMLAQIVDLRFFCGFTFAEIAAMRGLSERSVQRHWRKARLFLHDAIRDASAAHP
jgi:RNA polymerase sigma factor (TIGR02999 family)